MKKQTQEGESSAEQQGQKENNDSSSIVGKCANCERLLQEIHLLKQQCWQQKIQQNNSSHPQYNNNKILPDNSQDERQEPQLNSTIKYSSDFSQSNIQFSDSWQINGPENERETAKPKKEDNIFTNKIVVDTIDDIFIDNFETYLKEKGLNQKAVLFFAPLKEVEKGWKKLSELQHNATKTTSQRIQVGVKAKSTTEIRVQVLWISSIIDANLPKAIIKAQKRSELNILNSDFKQTDSTLAQIQLQKVINVLHSVEQVQATTKPNKNINLTMNEEKFIQNDTLTTEDYQNTVNLTGYSLLNKEGSQYDLIIQMSQIVQFLQFLKHQFQKHLPAETHAEVETIISFYSKIYEENNKDIDGNTLTHKITTNCYNFGISGRNPHGPI